MRLAGRAAHRCIPRLLCLLALLAFPALLASAAPAPAPPATDAARPAASAANTPSPSPAAAPPGMAMHGVAQLDGPWHFQIGDDPRWADPAFDDSAWPTIELGKTLVDQGFESYAGYAWYRMRVQPRKFHGSDANAALQLLITPHYIGQAAVFLNGVSIGHTRGMNDNNPTMYQCKPLVISIPQPVGDAPLLIAIRTWAAPGFQISHGLLDRVEAGSPDDITDRFALAIARRWDQQIIATIVLVVLFLGVAALGGILFFAQRHHHEYLWLGLLCLTLSLRGAFDVSGGLGLIPNTWSWFLSMWLDWVFLAVTLEFVLEFTGTTDRRRFRFIQALVLVLPFLSLAHLEMLHQVLTIVTEIVFCTAVCVLLFRAWRRGQREAGAMLIPFFLAAMAESIDSAISFAGERHWMAGGMDAAMLHIGPIQFTPSIVTYAVFLSSLIALILYRFVSVSQEEQRSNAEIAAARSVQAMLIPTELPSNNHLMLESAYIPVNGVGGDFFQVLPVEDGSMMVVVGDVSGKGLQAAMNASTLVGAFRNELSHDPATILSHLNNILLGAMSGPGGARGPDAVVSFATCLCARIYRDGTMEIANAGHLSPYRDGRELELPPGLPLGVIPGMTYEQLTFQLQQGQRLIFLSDGVVEAANDRGELFGFERTQQVSNEPARYIAQTAKRFGQNDDITVISVYIVSRDAPTTTRKRAQVPVPAS